MPLPSKVVVAAVQMIADGDLPMAHPAEPRPRVLPASRSRRSSPIPLGLAMGHVRARRAQRRSAGRELPSDRGDRHPAARDPVARHRHRGRGAASSRMRRSSRSSSTPLRATKRINPTLLQAAATMGLSRFTTIRTVVVPAALPSIGVGLRIAMGVAWTAIVAAELAVGAKAGRRRLRRHRPDDVRVLRLQHRAQPHHRVHDRAWAWSRCALDRLLRAALRRWRMPWSVR